MKKAMILSAVMVMGGVCGARAQDAPPAPGAPHPRMMHGDEQRGGERGPERGGPAGLLPPGTWWRNQDVIAKLGLTTDQQKKIDDTFIQSRVQLIHMHASLEEEQLKLEPLLNANPVNQQAALAQIGKIADTRAELEKADAKMLLSIRAVLSAEQWTKLRETHDRMGRGDGRGDGRGNGHGDGRGPGPDAGRAPRAPGQNDRAPRAPQTPPPGDE